MDVFCAFLDNLTTPCPFLDGTIEESCVSLTCESEKCFCLFCLNVNPSLLQATINIVFGRVGKTDPVTRGIEITVNYLGIQFDVSLY